MQRNVLFLDKVIIRGKKGNAVTGAERFNLGLLGHIQEHQIKATVFASRSWCREISVLSDNGNLEVVKLPNFFKIAWPNTVLSNIILRLQKKSYDALILGNVGRSLLPLVRLQFSRKVLGKVLLFAHREPTALFIRMLKGLPVTIVAVNEKIANSFREAGFIDTHVYFGEIRTEMFSPKSISMDDYYPSEKKCVNFCVFGSLDSEWKGSDVAVRAFGLLPQEVQKNSKLHLAGFDKKLPKYDNPNIVVYPWIPEVEVPDFLRTMDVAIIPSRDTDVMKETFSQASVQAMLSGLPLIVSSLPVLKDKVQSGGGLVFSDESELVEHMYKMFSDGEFRSKLAKESYEIAQKRFLWDTKYFVETFLFPEGSTATH